MRLAKIVDVYRNYEDFVVRPFEENAIVGMRSRQTDGFEISSSRSPFKYAAFTSIW